jgi:hypothetical protein
MKRIDVLTLAAALLISASQWALAQTAPVNPFPPGQFGAPNYGIGPSANGLYGPGYYAPNGIGLGAPQPIEVDPSLRFGTYPSYPSAGPRAFGPILGEPFRELSRVTWPSRGPIVIRHRADAKDDLHYTLNGLKYSIKPGYEQKFEDDRKWIIAFGDEKTEKPKRYTLTAGAYRFIARADGYDLFEQVAKGDAPAASSGGP